jgi:hypothetical protein
VSPESLPKQTTARPSVTTVTGHADCSGYRRVSPVTCRQNRQPSGGDQVISEQDARPDIKTEQERHPPQRLDDPEQVAHEERKFGLAIPITVALISILFILVIIIYEVR